MLTDFGATLLTIWAAYAVATLVPGPNVVFVATSALLGGRPRGVAAAAGVATATLIWSSLGVAGLGAMLTARPDLALWVRAIGAAVLLWLGWTTFRANRHRDWHGDRPRKATTGFIGGILTGCSNPMSALIWATAASTILATQPSPAEIALYVLSCAGLALAIYGTLALTVARMARPSDPRRETLIRIVCSGSFVLLAGILIGV